MSQGFLFGDFVAHVKNCVRVRFQFVTFRHSKLIEAVCKILKEEGYISQYEVYLNEELKKIIHLKLIHYNGLPTIQLFSLCSKPGRRVYKMKKDIKPFKNGVGLTIFSTSQGVISYRDAIKRGIGGEMLCVIF